MAGTFKIKSPFRAGREGYRRTFQRQTSDTSIYQDLSPSLSDPPATAPHGLEGPNAADEASTSSVNRPTPLRLSNEDRYATTTAGGPSTNSSGLGISLENLPSPQQIYSPRSPTTPGSTDPLISPYLGSHHSREVSFTSPSNISPVWEHQSPSKGLEGRHPGVGSTSQPLNWSLGSDADGGTKHSPHDGGESVDRLAVTIEP